VNDETGFILDAAGPDGLSVVFEDDGETGYLYLYEPDGRGVVRDLHIYNRTDEVQPSETDVHCKWSTDMTRCGVFVWGVLRGVLDVANGTETRIPILERASQGITDSRWLAGFSD
jgi:hypothetical protein